MDKVVKKDFSNKGKSVIYSIVRFAIHLHDGQGAFSEAGCKREFSRVAYEGKHMRDRIMIHKNSLDLCYTIRVLEGMSGGGKDCQEQILDLHEQDMKRLLCFYRKLIRENKQFLDEADMECREQLHENMEYALKYLDIYDQRVDMRRMCTAMDDLVFLYGLSNMIEKGIELIRCFNPKKGKIYGEIIRRYFCSDEGNTDEDVIDMLSEWISRRQYYREKKDAIRWMGYYFFEVVVPQMKNGSLDGAFTVVKGFLCKY